MSEPLIPNLSNKNPPNKLPNMEKNANIESTLATKEVFNLIIYNLNH